MSRRSRVTRRRKPPSAAPITQEVSSGSAPRRKTSWLPPVFSWQFLIVVAFHFLLFTVPLFFTWVNEELFEFNKMLLTYGMTVIITGFWTARMITERRWILRRTPLDYPILMFVVSQLISTLFSIHAPTSWFGYYTRFHGGLLSTVAYVTLFYAFVSNVRSTDLRSLLKTTLLASLFVSAMAIPEHFGRSFSCLLINTAQGMSQSGVQVFTPSTLLQSYNASCWIQDVQTRVFASFGQPNWLAAYAITLLPVGYICLWNAAERRRWAAAGFYALAVIGLFLDLLFTKSRSGLLGLAAGIAVFTSFLALRWFLDHRAHLSFGVVAAKTWATSRFRSWQNTLRSPVFLCTTTCLVLAILFGTPYTPGLEEKFTRSQTSSTATAPTTTAAGEAPLTNRLDIGGTDSGDIRKIVWTGAVRVWKRYPLFGSGVETFAYSYYLDRPIEHNLVSEWDFLYNKAHNEFLNYLATTGFFGFFAYVMMLGAFIAAPLWEMLRRHWKISLQPLHISYTTQPEVARGYRLQLLDIAVSSGIVALSVSNFFGFSTVMVTLLMYLLPAMVFVHNREETEPTRQATLSIPQSLRSLAFEQFFFFGLLAIVLLLTLGRLSTWWYTDSLYAQAKQYSQIGKLNTSVPLIQQAVSLSPNDGTYQEELSLQYAKLAAGIAEGGDATAATQIANQAIQVANRMLELNQVNVNFYKTYTRVLLTLAPYQTSLLYQARDVLTHAVQLAPTDAKILYNLALVELSMDFQNEGLRHLEQVVAMKPNYEAARLSLGEQYESLGRRNEARAQYEYILSNIQPNNEKAIERATALQKGK